MRAASEEPSPCQRWLQACLDWIYPPRCPACRRFTDHHGQWCPDCGPAAGPVQQLPLAGRRLEALAAGYYLFAYEGTVRNLLRRLKFQSLKGAAPPLRWLLTHRADWREMPRYDMVVPVPLHPDRRAERGFNQTELLFRSWAESRGLSWREVLSRHRATRPQWQLSLTERRQNIKDAFSLTRPDEVKRVTGKHILLVDDIFTTGLTLNACAAVLKQAGAASVTGLAFASGAGV